ncbi:MAG: methionine--tRNA ligase [Clostridia bacterium]|nr:methionine--tRNA ligase [Clostridia bacterium]
MENKGKFYITTAIAYASGKPHIGNVYDPIVADVIARYKRALGYDVFFCTGTDEHGQKIENKAKDAGVSPQEFVDNISGTIKSIWDMLGISYDHFIRTTDDYHVKAVQKIFTKFVEQGDIYKGAYEGWYCEPCESFFTDTQAEGGICPDCGRPLKRAQEEAYFFKMSKYQDQLMAYIEEHPDFAVPESRRKEMVNNFLKPGLQDLCVSRSSFTWGIPVEVDPKHVTYVWLDALTNYITALGYNPEGSDEKYKKYWPADVHVIGKDIIRFHMIYWPIFLMAMGEPLPKKIFAHPWMLSGMDKMSKSRGNVIYPDKLVNAFGLDAVRYYLLTEMPFANDGTITYENVISRFNTDLANTFGNLASRTIAMTKKYFNGVIPCPTVSTEFDESLKTAAAEAYKGFTENIENYHAADAIEAAMNLAVRANKYIDETTPWSLAKDETMKPRLEAVIYNLLETLRITALLLSPIMPESCKKILEALCAANDEFESAATFGGLKAGNTVGEVGVLFARIDEKKKLDELNAENA